MYLVIYLSNKVFMMTLLSIDSCGICQHLKALRKKKQKTKSLHFLILLI